MSGELMLFVRRSGGDKVPVVVPHTATVGDLLAECGCGQLAAASYGGAQLHRDQPLADAGVCSEAVVDVVECTSYWGTIDPQMTYSGDGKATARLDQEVGQFANAVCVHPITDRCDILLEAEPGSKVTTLQADKLTGVHVGLAPRAEGSQGDFDYMDDHYIGDSPGTFGFSDDGTSNRKQSMEHREESRAGNGSFTSGDIVTLHYNEVSRELNLSINGERQPTGFQDVPPGLHAVVSMGYPSTWATLLPPQ
eukprot:TRINITY_DN5576_c0_g1_i2.p1 TRINITY_DN5576_c0_g1~~TRINITY_DN5576_c0_g1_i2.p1  ORF type:complete len:278 (+),score=57.65 TRINITY_DN5576_c0_g1_i2:84-836(+)